jgi:hypothetical protein
MIAGDQSRISGYNKELQDIDAKISEIKARTTPTAESMREERAEAEKTNVQAESNQHLTDVASNTGSTVEVLQSVQNILSEMLEAIRTNNTVPDTSANAKGPVAPDYGRMVKNTRPGSINRQMTYTQTT